MKRLVRIVLVAIVLISTSLVSKAQNDGITFTLLPQMPYANYLNPGIKMPYSGIVGVGISNISYSIFNSSVRYKNIYGVNAQGNDVIDGVKLVNSLNEQDNFINGNFSFDVLNLGFRVKNLFIDIDWRMKINSELQFSKDFVGFFVLGNGQYLGPDNPCDFNVGVDISSYSEFGVGIQYDITDHLTVGVRPKFLLGVSNVALNNDRTKIYTDADSYAVTADVNLDIKASSNLHWEMNRIGDLTKFVDFESMDIKDFFNFKKSYGFGVDLGASYVFNKHFGVAVGAYDIGFITWRNTKVKKTSTENLELNSAVFSSIADMADLNLNYNSMLSDVMKKVWGDGTLTDGDDYTTYLKTKIMLQGYFELSPMLRLTAIGQMYYVKEQMRPAITLAYSGAFLRFLNLSVSYTHSKYAGNSIGAGVGFHMGPLNVYAVTDNLMVLTKITAPTIEMSTTYNAVNFRLGLALTFGRYESQKERFEN